MVIKRDAYLEQLSRESGDVGNHSCYLYCLRNIYWRVV